MSARRVCILIADDESRLRDALSKMVADEPGFDLVGTAADAEEAIALAERHRPDVALVGVRMPRGGGRRATREITSRCPDTRVIGLSAYDDTAARVAMFRAGAAGYLVKEASVEEIVDAIRATARGNTAESAEPPSDAASKPALRIMLVDDDDRFRDALAEALAGQVGFELVGFARDSAEASQLVVRARPHVAIVDTRIADGGPRVVRDITARAPGLGVVAVSAYMTKADVLPMLQAGATSYLVKGAAIEEIVAAVISARNGGSHLSDEVTSGVISELVGQLDREQVGHERHRESVDRIQRVIDDGGPAIALQPIFDLEGAAFVGVEALARFNGVRPRTPNEWFAEAESVGLGVELEMRAVRRALECLHGVPDEALLFVNLSPGVAAAPECPQVLGEAPADRVVIEMTEHAAVSDYEVLNRALAPLRDLGVRIAIDDVGAGFASLQHIVRLSPDFIKLDIQLTRGIGTDESHRAMAHALTAFAQSTGMTLVAEGVETADQLGSLRRLGVPLAQGYLLARPSPPEQLVTAPPPLLRAAG